MLLDLHEGFGVAWGYSDSGWGSAAGSECRLLALQSTAGGYLLLARGGCCLVGSGPGQ
jgi:hypothetical protein